MTDHPFKENEVLRRARWAFAGATSSTGAPARRTPGKSSSMVDGGLTQQWPTSSSKGAWRTR
eukprot:4200498-Pyramimonas_sp.AAC.1